MGVETRVFLFVVEVSKGCEDLVLLKVVGGFSRFS